MSRTKHTQGPWTYNCGNGGSVVYKEDIGTIANVPDDLISSEANARLIAATPDMVEALKNLLEDALNFGMASSPMSGSLIEARKALAKAGVA